MPTLPPRAMSFIGRDATLDCTAYDAQEAHNTAIRQGQIANWSNEFNMALKNEDARKAGQINLDSQAAEGLWVQQDRELAAAYPGC
jgi:hypothetical protein